ncbi:uncharacterized protein [Ptychodera flava]|uniref:uncharacterized protein isoform X2 n=1 Tax=Ptychodera flava TaxID=63121 RepID=UPI00396AA4F2
MCIGSRQNCELHYASSTIARSTSVAEDTPSTHEYHELERDDDSENLSSGEQENVRSDLEYFEPIPDTLPRTDSKHQVTGLESRHSVPSDEHTSTKVPDESTENAKLDERSPEDERAEDEDEDTYSLLEPEEGAHKTEDRSPTGVVYSEPFDGDEAENHDQEVDNDETEMKKLLGESEQQPASGHTDIPANGNDPKQKREPPKKPPRSSTIDLQDEPVDEKIPRRPIKRELSNLTRKPPTRTNKDIVVLVLAILSTIFCFIPFGVVAIVLSSLALSNHNKYGGEDKGKRYTKYSCIFSVASLVAGAVVLTVVIVMLVIDT